MEEKHRQAFEDLATKYGLDSAEEAWERVRRRTGLPPASAEFADEKLHEELASVTRLRIYHRGDGANPWQFEVTWNPPAPDEDTGHQRASCSYDLDPSLRGVDLPIPEDPSLELLLVYAQTTQIPAWLEDYDVTDTPWADPGAWRAVGAREWEWTSEESGRCEWVRVDADAANYHDGRVQVLRCRHCGRLHGEASKPGIVEAPACERRRIRDRAEKGETACAS